MLRRALVPGQSEVWVKKKDQIQQLVALIDIRFGSRACSNPATIRDLDRSLVGEPGATPLGTLMYLVEVPTCDPAEVQAFVQCWGDIEQCSVFTACDVKPPSNLRRVVFLVRKVIAQLRGAQ